MRAASPFLRDSSPSPSSQAFLSLACSAALSCSAAGSSQPIDLSDASSEQPVDGFIVDFGVPDGPLVCMEGAAAVPITPDQDWDQDGWSIDQGDCNDCDRNANPGAYDVPDNWVDEDCSGTPDDEPTDCDRDLALASNEAQDGARALGLCRFSHDEPSDPRQRIWGVVSADYVQADGSFGMHYASHGVLPDFGPYVRAQQGAALLGLSSATARRPGDPAFQAPDDADMGTTCATPAGWPKASPSCPQPQSTTAVADDSAALELRIRVPTNAHALSFRLNFFTSEFPVYVCNQYNDFFVALLESQADNPEQQDGNISFDSLGNPISVNTAFLDACVPQVAGGHAFACLLGNATLTGNGFDATSQDPRGHAAPGWLETHANVVAGETIRLRFAVWDGGDHLRGSTVLLDAFSWQAEAASGPVTVRVPNPK